MSLVVPNAAEVRALQYILTPPLTLRIFGNNVIPGPLSTAASFTEIAGGGYTNRPLLFAGWAILRQIIGFHLQRVYSLSQFDKVLH